MSILTAVQDAMNLLELGQPNQVVSNTDLAVRQFLAMAQREVDDTFPQADWRNGRIDVTITGDNVTTLFEVPNDWERPIPGSMWWSDKYPSIPLIGPVTEMEVLRLKALPVKPIRPIWRLIGGMIEIWPALSTGENVRGVYYSAFGISSADSLTRYLRWTNDTDFPLFPGSILTNGIIWRWKHSKGLDYAEDFRTYERDKALRMAHERGSRIIHMSDSIQIPANNWPGVISINP